MITIGDLRGEPKTRTEIWCAERGKIEPSDREIAKLVLSNEYSIPYLSRKYGITHKNIKILCGVYRKSIAQEQEMIRRCEKENGKIDYTILHKYLE